MSKFKVGDRVMVVNVWNYFARQIGTVARLQDEPFPVCVSFAEYGDVHYEPNELKLIKEDNHAAHLTTRPEGPGGDGHRRGGAEGTAAKEGEQAEGRKEG